MRKAISEWRNPELLFRYLDANRKDEQMRPLIVRWLRSIFGLSEESLRMIRRESPENIRHLLAIPQAVLLRWYAQECPGSSKCKTLFMVGEDAGSCLRIISNEVLGRCGEMWGDMGGYREPRACGSSPAYTLTVTRATGTTARCSGTCCSRTCAPSWCTTASAA